MAASSQSRALKQAAAAGDLGEVQRLVDAGADVNGCDEQGSGTLLTVHPDVMQYLLTRGADPNVQTNENGASVLAGLAYLKARDCVRMLLEAGADPNRGRNASLESPLHHALAGSGAKHETVVVRLLLDAGADVNMRTRAGVESFNFWRDARTRGETPLHRAAAYASVETIELLLARGADPLVRDVNGDSPLSWASWHRRPREIIELLMSAAKDAR